MIWAPFLHLSANIVKERYSLTDGFAAVQAAILLSGALILYPVVSLFHLLLNRADQSDWSNYRSIIPFNPYYVLQTYRSLFHPHFILL